MRRDVVISLAGWLVIASMSAVFAAPVLNPKLGVVFSADRARSLLKQYSREVPQKVQGVWVPGKGDILRLERSFPAAVARAMDEHGLKREREQVLARLGHYARQYGGLTIANHKFIYVNAFPTHLIDFDRSDLTKSMYPQWRERAAIVCGGGPGLFGALFDPVTNQFSQFAFNGTA